MRTPNGDHDAAARPGAAPGGPPAARSPQISVRERLAGQEVAAVAGLVGAAASEDGLSPLSEHVLLHLRYGGDPKARDLLLVSDGVLAGYAHLDLTDPAEGPSGELVIHPRHRRQGLGLALLRALIAQADDRPLRLWAHGDLPAASQLAAAAGFRRVRALWRMRRPLSSQPGEPKLAEGVTVRTFRVGRDEDAWLRLNARAFARHPEQGAWTREDLDQREREPWFDPAGFFLATRHGRLAGFHWTKIHAKPGAGAAPAQEPIGEVYVIGVDPAEQGTGLGRALTLIGLRYLRARGLSAVMLYVDEANQAAIRLYESLDFAHQDTDVMFSNANAAPGRG